MGITLFISLYSTRLILASLGEIDFGIFSVIGGSIAMMGFLNSTLANATQRFMSYAEGRGNLHDKRVIFNVSLVLHLFIASATVILLISIMPFLFDKLLNIAQERLFASHIVYYSLVFSTFLTIINVPYDAVLNAHENMLYYSLIGILESIIKLGIAFICVYAVSDKLIIYGILMGLMPFITLSIMKVYCHRHYEECEVSLKRYWDRKVMKKIAKFSGWNFLTAISSLFTVQGLSVVLNHYFGPILNAAQGIAVQVNGQLAAFSTNMMKALNPVIVKRTARMSSPAVSSVTFSGAKFSAILILLFAVPASIKMNYILSIWLEEVPVWSVLFCQLQLINTVIVQVANPLSTAVYGKGDIQRYAIWKSIMNILPLVFTIISFQLHGSPVWQYVSLIIFLGIGGDIVIAHYASIKCGLSSKTFLREVVIPVGIVATTMLICGEMIDYILPYNNFIMFVACGIATTIGLIVSLYYFGVTTDEKRELKYLFKKTLSKLSIL